MLTNTNSQLINSTLLATDFLVDKESYESLKSRITEQYLKNIEVAGFRKGHAPRELAIKKSDPIYIENLIYNEVISRNFPEAEKMLKDEMQKDGQTILSIGLSQDAEFIGPDEQGFKFRLVSNLLPKVDLETIKSLEVKTPVESDLPKRITIKEFQDREAVAFLGNFNEYVECDEALKAGYRAVSDVTETNLSENTPSKTSSDVLVAVGLKQFPPEFESNVEGSKAGDTKEFVIEIKNTALNELQKLSFSVLIKTVQKPKYNSIQELFEESDFVKENFGTIEQFNTRLVDTYNKETEDLLRDAKLKLSMSTIIDKIGDVEINEEDATSEIDRIYAEFQKNDNPSEVFNDSYFPYSKKATEKTLKDEIGVYVRGEFKMAKICLSIYYREIEEKVTEEELLNYVKEIQVDPTKYGYSASISKDDLKDRIFDNLLRNKSYAWILNTIKFN